MDRLVVVRRQEPDCVQGRMDGPTSIHGQPIFSVSKLYYRKGIASALLKPNLCSTFLWVIFIVGKIPTFKRILRRAGNLYFLSAFCRIEKT